MTLSFEKKKKKFELYHLISFSIPDKSFWAYRNAHNGFWAQVLFSPSVSHCRCVCRKRFHWSLQKQELEWVRLPTRVSALTRHQPGWAIDSNTQHGLDGALQHTSKSGQILPPSARSTEHVPHGLFDITLTPRSLSRGICGGSTEGSRDVSFQGPIKSCAHLAGWVYHNVAQETAIWVYTPVRTT